MDKTSKIILAAIAAGLWANVAVALLHSTPARADENFELMQIDQAVGSIALGACVNPKICH
jgi:hypothetical protein